MEMIYGEGFLSPGALANTEALAKLGEIGTGMRVLDVGSGLGGAAAWLAENLRCHVEGIDLMEASVEEANRRLQQTAHDGRVRFVVGDACALPFEAETFDVVWGQDAWCHVDDKQRLIAEAARVLEGGGRIVFSDWLLLDLQSPYSDEVKKVTASPQMADVHTYLSALQAHGFTDVEHVDTSAAITAVYVEVLARLRDLKSTICDRFESRVYDIVEAKQTAVLEAFVDGHLGSGMFTGIKA